jgi:hypothetical protein
VGLLVVEWLHAELGLISPGVASADAVGVGSWAWVVWVGFYLYL